MDSNTRAFPQPSTFKLKALGYVRPESTFWIERGFGPQNTGFGALRRSSGGALLIYPAYRVGLPVVCGSFCGRGGGRGQLTAATGEKTVRFACRVLRHSSRSCGSTDLLFANPRVANRQPRRRQSRVKRLTHIRHGGTVWAIMLVRIL